MDECNLAVTAGSDPEITSDSLLELYYNDNTGRVFKSSINNLSAYMKWNVNDAVTHICKMPQADLFKLIMLWMKKMLDDGLSPNTVRTRVSSIRSILNKSRVLGLTQNDLTGIKLPKADIYRDTKGVDTKTIIKMDRACMKKHVSIRKRDRAILWTLYILGLRRSELLSMKREDTDLSAGHTFINQKGGGRLKITIPKKLCEIIQDWIDEAPESQYIWINKDGGLLNVKTIYRIIFKLGQIVGVKVRPHGIRHSSVTAALDLTGDVRSVQRFSRHKKIDTVIIYDDNNNDMGGKVANLLADQLNGLMEIGDG